MVRALSLVLLLTLGSAQADDAVEKIFSGPQPGEKLTGFKVQGMFGRWDGKEADPIADANQAPTVLIFVHEWTRPMLQLARGLDTYGDKWAGKGLKTYFVNLTADKSKTEQFLQGAKNSLNLKCPQSISLDGLEGPGNYGLNRKMTATVVIAKGNKVTANFAIVQPNETDSPKVLAAVADLLGEPKPTQEQISAATQGPARPNPNANAPDQALTSLMRQLIQKDNDEAKVKETVAAMLKWAGEDAAKKKQLKEYCQKIVGLGYGNELAQRALKRLAAE
ncbi:MAG: hypothetical protein JNM56_38670 [Planctomycetia bacterium]|nr:hypothetical protein [Planctomycetia bacterium]